MHIYSCSFHELTIRYQLDLRVFQLFEGFSYKLFVELAEIDCLFGIVTLLEMLTHFILQFFLGYLVFLLQYIYIRPYEIHWHVQAS